MKEKLKKVVDQGNQLINEIQPNNNPKKEILLNRAKLSLKTFQITINKLIE